jgi:hypothetical protein
VIPGRSGMIKPIAEIVAAYNNGVIRMTTFILVAESMTVMGFGGVG